MKQFALSASIAAALAVFPLSALAAPVGVDGTLGAEWSGVTPTSVPGGASGPGGNFGSPTADANVPYNIYLRDDGSYLYILLTTADTNVSVGTNNFANVYFDTNAATSGTGSDLGFEITNDDAFLPGTSATPGNLAGTGDFFFAQADSGGVYGIEAAISNSLLINDLLGLGYTSSGTEVSLHLSQAFGYQVVGGNVAYPVNFELGEASDASLGTAATPEPSSIALLGTGILGAAGMVRRRFSARS